MLNGLRDYFQPVGTLEEILVEKLASLFWRESRLTAAESNADILRERSFLELSELGLNAPPQWDLFLKYEMTLDRTIDRTLAQLERYQRLRLGHPVLPTIKVDVL